MNDGQDLASFSHAGVRVSALVPETWEASEVSGNSIRFFGPAHPDLDDYRPTFSITLGEPNGFGEEWFRQFTEASLENLRRECSGFALRATERFTLSSLVDVHAVWYTWDSESGLAFAQLQALGLMDRYHMYLINAATLLPLADLHLPAFDGVLRSLRMLPAFASDNTVYYTL